MKQHLIIILTGATLLWSTLCHAVGELGANGGNNSNPHNLSSLSGNNSYKAVSETQICIFCHTPHGATPQSTLWGRPDPTGMGSFLTLTNPALGISDPTVVGFSLYDSSSGDYPNGASKLCLSCHDGVTAMGILSNGDEIEMAGGALSPNFAIDLTKSHPISFVYDSVVLPKLTALGKSLKLPTADYLDGSNRVQCTSCHQPHQDTMSTNGLPFWRVVTGDYSTAYNTVCNACHTAAPSLGTGHGYP